MWANNDKTISVSFDTAETEVKMSLEEAKQKFMGAIQAAEEMTPVVDYLKTRPEGEATITSQSHVKVVDDPFRRPPPA